MSKNIPTAYKVKVASRNMATTKEKSSLSKSSESKIPLPSQETKVEEAELSQEHEVEETEWSQEQESIDDVPDETEMEVEDETVSLEFIDEYISSNEEEEDEDGEDIEDNDEEDVEDDEEDVDGEDIDDDNDEEEDLEDDDEEDVEEDLEEEDENDDGDDDLEDKHIQEQLKKYKEDELLRHSGGKLPPSKEVYEPDTTEDITLFGRYGTGKNKRCEKIKIDRQATVAEIKVMFSTLINRKVKIVECQFVGGILDDDRTLESLEINDGEFVELYF